MITLRTLFCAVLAVASTAPLDAAALRPSHARTFAPAITTAAAPLASAAANGIGSSNTITADRPVPRPAEAPCVDRLFTGATFAQYAGLPFTYAPPAGCPGPYAKIVFNGDFSVTAGRQFDRTASVQIGNVPLYFGTTAEPRGTLSPSWHVERDVTDDAALLSAPQTAEADIFNIVDTTYTGIIHGTAYLQFYPARGRFAPAATPDVVLPFPGVPGGPQHLDTPASLLTETIALPTNVVRAYLDVYAQSQQTDEQYFLCAPTDVAAELFACPNTAFRETEIAIDGKPAGAAPVFPWIFTGGLDPYLWEPIPGVQTLEFKPYRVDLTPFAAVLSDGKPHTVTVGVDGADAYFQAIGTLLAFQDRGAKKVGGALTSDTLDAHPQPAVQEQLTGTSPSVDGTIVVSNQRNYRISGYVDTSHGRVTTTVAGTLDFANRQSYANESATTGTLTAQQATTAVQETRSTGAGGFSISRHGVSYPLSVSLTSAYDATFTGTQQTTVDQRFIEAAAELSPRGIFASYTSNEVTPSDTLDILNGASITGNSGQKSTQTYQAFDTAGTCYSRTVAAANNVVTAVTSSVCDRAAATRALGPMLTR